MGNCKIYEDISIKSMYELDRCAECELNKDCTFTTMIGYSDDTYNCAGELVSSYRYLD